MAAPQNAERILALDGFRGLAVLMVTLYRFCEVSFTEPVIGNLPSKAVFVGASGVDLFFVLSGFLITGILLESKETSNYFASFYVRRALRIFPLYFGSLVLFLFLLPWLGNNSVMEGLSTLNIRQIQGDTIHLWLYTCNLSIAWFADWHYGAMNHYWSLAIEEQFYLVWPMIVFCLAPIRLLKLCLVAFVFLAIVRIGYSFSGINDIGSKTFTLFRMDGLLLGGAASILFRTFQDELSKVRNRLRIGFVVACILFCFTLVMGNEDFTVRYTLVSVAGAFLLLSTLTCKPNGLERRIFETCGLRSLGKYSYAMYIFQLPLIPLMAPWLSPQLCTRWAGSSILGASIYVVFMFGLTYLLAFASWYLFEVHFLNLRKHFPASISKQAPKELPGN